MKKIIIVLFILLSVLAGITFWLLNNIDHLAKNAMIKYGSEMTEAKVRVDQVHIDIKEGLGTISNLTIGNPKGFKTPYALDIKSFTIEVDPLSLTQDVVIIKKINIDSPSIIYEKNESITNFDALQKNIAHYIALRDEKNGGDKPSKTHGDEAHPKKFIVGELTIRHAKAEASSSFMEGKTIALQLPDITLTNIGKAQGGITSAQLGLALTESIRSHLLNSFNFDALKQTIQNSSEKIKESAKKIKDGSIDSLKKLF